MPATRNYDIARIQRIRPIANKDFWLKAAEDFRLACESRYVDCEGLVTFQQSWAATQQAFETDPTLPKDVTFEEAANALESIVGFLEKEKILPFFSPLPVTAT